MVKELVEGITQAFNLMHRPGYSRLSDLEQKTLVTKTIMATDKPVKSNPCQIAEGQGFICKFQGECKDQGKCPVLKLMVS